MKKGGILNSNLSRVIAAMGHTDKLVIGDSGLPIPRNSELVDLALKPNVPRFLETLETILEELVVEEAIISKEMETKNKEVVSYIRPHDIEIRLEAEGKEFIDAEIVFIRAVGPIVNLELKRLDNKEYIEADISKEVYRKLALKEKQKVYIRPRDYKVFIPDYTI